MKIRTSELIGVALDWAVAKALGELRPAGDVMLQDGFVLTIRPGDYETPDAWHQYAPSTDWAQGGPIIEQESLLVQPEIGKQGSGNAWSVISMASIECYGPTPIIAAMRCCVCEQARVRN